MGKDKLCEHTGCKEKAVKDKKYDMKYCVKHAKYNADQEVIKKQQEEMQKKNEKEKKEKEEKLKKEMELEKIKKEKAAALILKLKQAAKVAMDDIEKRVKELREANPTRTGINAGENRDVYAKKGDTAKKSVKIPGGSDSRLELKWPIEADSLGVTKATVTPMLTGFESSDSAGIKCRVGPKNDIFIHFKWT